MFPAAPLLGWISFLSKGAAPTTNRAIFGEASDASSCEAPLRFLAPRLHLISFATAADQLMLRHFVDHYTSLGLAPARMLVFVFAPAGGGGEALVEMLHTDGAAQSRLVTAAYNDSFKLQLINGHLASLPEDAWAMTPDVDELYHYPCSSLPRLVSRGADLFCGIMEDMLAQSGGLERLEPQPSLQAQYPHRCRVRPFLKRFTPYKVVLAQVRPVRLLGEARQFCSTLRTLLLAVPELGACACSGRTW